MTDITITDADDYKPKMPVDERGRVTIGNKYAGKEVNVVVEVVDDD